MADPITQVTGSVTNYGTGTTAGTSSNQLDSEAFLKLLVAQLRFQDPSRPTDASQFLSQTAQFTLVERVEELSTLNDQLLATTRSASAVGLVGRTVSWTDGAGKTVEGIVSGVKVTGGQVVLEVGSQEISLDRVTRVREVRPTP
ncbi:MAG: flagellar hook capping protein [Actinomycetales bacterium]|nr:flagellar hook capping protein [Actinomycetales bacterium]